MKIATELNNLSPGKHGLPYNLRPVRLKSMDHVAEQDHARLFMKIMAVTPVS